MDAQPHQLRFTQLAAFFRRYPAFARLFWADALSQLAQGMVMVAFPVFLLQVTGDVTVTGLSFAMEMAAFALCSPLAGALADRLEQKWVMQAANLTRLLLLWSLLRLIGQHQLLPCLQVALALGASAAFFTPARTAFLRRLMTGDDLLRAVSLEGTVNFLLRLLAPALVGLLLALLPAGAAIGSAMVIYALAVVLLGPAWVTGPRQPAPPRESAPWMIGWRHILTTPAMRTLLALDALMSLLSWASWASSVAFLQLIVHTEASRNGLLMATTGLMGALGSQLAPRFRPGRLGYLTVLGGLALSYLMVPQATTMGCLLALWAARGVALGVMLGWVNLEMARRTPAERIGRVQAAWEMSVRLAGFLGAVSTPWLLGHLGPAGSFALFGWLTLAAAVVGGRASLPRP